MFRLDSKGNPDEVVAVSIPALNAPNADAEQLIYWPIAIETRRSESRDRRRAALVAAVP